MSHSVTIWRNVNVGPFLPLIMGLTYDLKYWSSHIKSFVITSPTLCQSGIWYYWYWLCMDINLPLPPSPLHTVCPHCLHKQVSPGTQGPLSHPLVSPTYQAPTVFYRLLHPFISHWPSLFFWSCYQILHRQNSHSKILPNLAVAGSLILLIVVIRPLRDN